MKPIVQRAHSSWRMHSQALWILLAALSFSTQLFAQVQTQSSEAGVPIFQDYFNDGNDNGWQQFNRVWHVNLGRYIQDGDYVPNAVARGGWTLTHIADTSWRDYTLEATFDITNAPGQPSPDVHTATFLVRIQRRPGIEVGAASGSGIYYAFSVWPRGTSDPRIGCSTCVIPGGLIIFGKIVYGRQLVYKDREYSNAVVGTNQIKIKAHGKYLDFWVNGKLVFSYYDPYPIPYGGIGLQTTWESEAWFDNIVVRRIE